MFTKVDPQSWPVGGAWTELSYLITSLHKLTFQYQVIVETTMFSYADGVPRYRIQIVRWNRDPSKRPATSREVIGEYTDVRDAIPPLRLLLSIEKEQ